MKKLLVVCYTFPPYPGIGGRRWAKFAKYLHRNGVDIQVLAAAKKEKGNSAWTGDTEAYRDRIHFLPSAYPHALTIIPRNIVEKIRYRQALFMMKRRVSGNYYDQSVFWAKTLRENAEKFVQQGYNNILVSTAPFRSAWHLLTLKEKYPDVNFMVDFRDPWTENRTGFGFENLSPKRQADEQRYEADVITGYDQVFSVADEMNRQFELLDPENEEKFALLPNGFDKEDIPPGIILDPPADKLRLVFAGSMYDKALHIFGELCATIRELQNEESDWIGKLALDFYGTVPAGFFAHAQNLGMIKFHGKIDATEVYGKLAKASAGMLFLADDTNWSLSTKFHEYAGLKLPIAVFSRPGYTGRLVEEEGIGVALFSGEMKQGLKKLYDIWNGKQLIFSGNFQDTHGEVKFLAAEFEKYLI